MNRRSLLQLGAGLIVGEPARRAYSFLNGHGIERSLFAGDAMTVADVERAVQILRENDVSRRFLQGFALQVVLVHDDGARTVFPPSLSALEVVKKELCLIEVFE